MYDLAALNSATQYPSILTYHALGERGALTEEATEFHGEVILTEKVNGTNARIIVLPDGDWLIGSRCELLTARGDRVPNSFAGMVEQLRPVAERLRPPQGRRTLMVAYLELYGRRIGGQARQYTSSQAIGHRLFDIAFIPLSVLDQPIEAIASWRDHGGQRFAVEAVLQRAAEDEGLELTPRLGTVAAEDLPAGVEETGRWLAEKLPASLCALDEGAGGKAEGIVLRDSRRETIAKARFEDYQRAARAAEVAAKSQAKSRRYADKAAARASADRVVAGAEAQA